MKKNIQKKLGLILDPKDAIEWAITGDNTTRKLEDGKPGGLGLKFLIEFIELNGGKIQIASDTGYWSLASDGRARHRFSIPFPGTIVNIEINTADAKSYCLLSELSPKDIF